MQIEILPDADAVARRGAKLIAEAAREAIDARGKFLLAVSGGHTPWKMLRMLADEPLEWDKLHLFQVDERVAPAGDADRNLTHLRESLLEHAPIPQQNVHAMPVEMSDLDAAASQYARTLQSLAGNPPVMDLIHLGLGPDGHTASLVPGDSVLEVAAVDVAPTGGEYQGRRRMTLTYPTINRARRILWIVTGEDKPTALAKLLAGDRSVPAGRVEQTRAMLVASAEAVGNSEGRDAP